MSVRIFLSKNKKKKKKKKKKKNVSENADGHSLREEDTISEKGHPSGSRTQSGEATPFRSPKKLLLSAYAHRTRFFR